jgi:hypothetical protein
MAVDTARNTAPQEPRREPLTVRPRVAEQLLGIGETKRRDLVRSGTLEEIQLDGAKRITMRSIKRAAGVAD